jgi:hypothetical protein
MDGALSPRQFWLQVELGRTNKFDKPSSVPWCSGRLKGSASCCGHCTTETRGRTDGPTDTRFTPTQLVNTNSPEPLSASPGADSVDAASSESRASWRGAARRLWRSGAMRNSRGAELSRAVSGRSETPNSTMSLQQQNTHTYFHRNWGKPWEMWPGQPASWIWSRNLTVGVRSRRREFPLRSALTVSGIDCEEGQHNKVTGHMLSARVKQRVHEADHSPLARIWLRGILTEGNIFLELASVRSTHTLVSRKHTVTKSEQGRGPVHSLSVTTATDTLDQLPRLLSS